jgi:hypothetical protein
MAIVDQHYLYYMKRLENYSLMGWIYFILLVVILVAVAAL